IATPGYVVRLGDAIEAEGVRAVFERSRKVTWLLEQSGGEAVSRVRVKSVGEPLVLGLEQGAVEAQVVPVPMGEAFAVDIASGTSLVRVAVHGTHLRVARAGHRVVVDLTEGVVSIGVPPRTGVTYGTLVTAPAHVELDVTDLGTLRVDHDLASVRAAIPLGGHEPPPTLAARPDIVPAPSPPAPVTAPPPASPGKGAPARPEPPPGSRAPLSPREAIVAAVRDCAAARSRSGDVHVTVTSDLRLRVSAAGAVESAQFVPPLLPDVQSCAAQVIYKIRLEEPGLVTIPIEFSY
ncbi:MAG TPA: hypothetical protein VM925_04860, partial [Labilithrix sp.]|nr:hypothetical protein [Labilithrix sp.]